MHRTKSLMNDGIEGHPGWAESLDYLAWRGGHISLGAEAIGQWAHSDRLAEAGYLGIKLAGIGVRSSALPASLPSLAVCSHEAIVDHPRHDNVEQVEHIVGPWSRRGSRCQDAAHWNWAHCFGKIPAWPEAWSEIPMGNVSWSW
jgi:hypothetical protein